MHSNHSLGSFLLLYNKHLGIFQVNGRSSTKGAPTEMFTHLSSRILLLFDGDYLEETNVSEI